MRLFITKYPLLIFSVLFIIFRLPFFLWNFFPRIDGDSFEYFEYAYDIKNGIMPDFSIIPPLYSMLLFVITELGLSLKAIVGLQTILNLLAYLFLFDQLKKINVFPLWSLFVVMIGISFSSFNIQLETSIMTEGIYKPILVLFIAIIIRMYRNPVVKSNYVFLPFFAVIAALARSNGMYLYFFIVLIIGYIFLYRRNKYWNQLLLMITTFFILNAGWSVFNYVSYNTPLFGNTYRIKVIVGNLINNTRLNHNGNLRAFWQDAPGDSQIIYPYLKELNYVKEIQAKNIKNKPDLFVNYLYSSCEKDISFYLEILPERFNSCFSGNQLVPGPEELKIVKKCFNDTVCREYAIQGFIKGNNQFIEEGNYESFLDKVFYGINVLFGNVVFIIAFTLISFTVCLRALTNLSQISKETLLISIISLAYLLNVIVITMTHNRFVARYEQVGSFMIILSVFLFLGFYFKRRKR